MSDLIDTTEMYLRTIYELQEEGIVPLRARIAERLGHSGPTVSQTVARMERDGLLHVSGDRHLELSADGKSKAMRVMRKHRLAERLLVDVIGLEWEYVHEEACRWEHVISERVERKLLEILHNPTESPYGTPIPGLEELGATTAAEDFLDALGTLRPLTELAGAVGAEPVEVVVRRLGEPAQLDHAVLSLLHQAGLKPGATVLVRGQDRGVLVLTGPDRADIELDAEIAAHVFVAIPATISTAIPATILAE
ncbi:MAG: metal-dependent transcriptional regulator [Actinomycetota bacterium]|nr:metal-dependent transcriptional regulator [Actinomycetota bacterium]